MPGIFGTHAWTAENPFKADGRDLLPALRRFRNGEVLAHELTTLGTIGRVAQVLAFVMISGALLFVATLL